MGSGEEEEGTGALWVRKVGAGHRGLWETVQGQAPPAAPQAAATWRTRSCLYFSCPGTDAEHYESMPDGPVQATLPLQALHRELAVQRHHHTVLTFSPPHCGLVACFQPAVAVTSWCPPLPRESSSQAAMHLA